MSFLNRKDRFNRYFEGYEQRSNFDMNGQGKPRFVYVGDYYSPKIEPRTFTIRKIFYGVLFLVSAAVQIIAGIAMSIPMNRTRMMGVLQCLDILVMITSAVYLFRYLTAPYKMEIRSYKGAHTNFIIAHLICLAVSACVFVTAIITTFIYGGSFSAIYILWNLAYLVPVAEMFIMWRLESNTEYDRLPPENF